MKNRIYIISGLARIISLAAQVLMISVANRTVGIADVGTYVAILSFASILVAFFSYGQVARGYRKIPRMVKDGLFEDAGQEATTVFFTAVTSSLLFSLPALGIGFLVLESWKASSYAVLLGVGFMSGQIFGSIARSYGMIAWSEFFQNAFWRITVIAALIFQALFIDTNEWIGFSPMVIISSLASFLVGLSVMARCTDFQFHWFQKSAILGKLKFDVKNWAITILQAVITNVDILLASYLFDKRLTAIYFIVLSVSAFAAVPLTFTNAVIMPTISRMASGELVKNGAASVLKNTKFNILVSLIICIVLLALGNNIIKLISDEPFNAWPMLPILLVGQIVNSACGPTVLSAHIFNIEKYVIAFQLFALVVMLVFVPLFSSLYGITGLAIIASSRHVFVNAAIAFLIWKKAGFSLFTGKFYEL